jgi:hypothetical protein
MADASVFDRNMLALSRMNQDTAVRLTAVTEAVAIELRSSKTGKLIPCILTDGRFAPLHSLVDPEREAERLLARYPSGGFFVLLGFGGGYVARELLKHPTVSQVLIVDAGAAYLKSLLTVLDCSDIFLDPRVGMLVDPNENELGDRLLSTYFPSLSGDLTMIPLRSRTDADAAFFNRISDRLRELIATVSDDYSVQAYFGKRWFKNTLRNLRHAGVGVSPLPPVRRAIVTAAGPSLEDSIEKIRGLSGRYAVIATDTTLPCLLAHGIKPAIVVSIDCQHISYYHFICGIPEGIPLVLDLASPEELTRFSPNLQFFSSGHPFSRYIVSRWRRFPSVDTSGGNVTHAAVSLAETLGAGEILLFGADFSYPEGKSYARGTYIYPYFEKSQFRLSPLEHDFIAFVFRNTKVLREREGDAIRYTTKPLIGYKENLERYARTSRANLVPEPGRGVPIEVPSREARASRSDGFPLFSAGKPRQPLGEFISDYRLALLGLPLPTGSFGAYLASLDATQRDVLTTLLPTAARVRRERQNDGMGAGDLVGMVKTWVLGEIDACYREAEIPPSSLEG